MTSITSKWTVEVQSCPESDDLFLELPEELLAQVGWQIGDTIHWQQQPDNTWVLTKSPTD
jgi:uncharacterized membrane protein (UPF0127 family)